MESKIIIPNEITKRIIKEELPKCIGDLDIFIVNGFYLDSIPEDKKKFPMVIVETTQYQNNNSDYTYYETESTSSGTEKMFRITSKVQRLVTRIRVFSNNIFNHDPQMIAKKIHMHFAYPYSKKLKGDMQIIGVGSLLEISSGISYDDVKGYTVSIEYDMMEHFVEEVEFAEKTEVTVTIEGL